MRWYNGNSAADFSDAYGLKKLGIEHCKPFFTRGHLVDMVGLKGRMMEVGEVISVAICERRSRSRACRKAT